MKRETELETDAEYLARLERIALDGDFGRCEECGRVYALPLHSEYCTCEGCTPIAAERAEAEERHNAEMWADGHACPVDRDFFRKLMPE